MSSQSQSSDASPSAMTLPSNPAPIFELNQARRARVTADLEALRSDFLEWPTVEGLETFVEKKAEYNDMMQEMIGDYRAVIHEQRVCVEALRRATDRAEEYRLQEFHRALERMDPAEAEAARRAERERAFLVQKQHEVRAAALSAEIARVRARAREEFSLNESQWVYKRP